MHKEMVLNMKMKLKGKMLLLFIPLLVVFGIFLFFYVHFKVTQLATLNINNKLNSDSNLGLTLLNEKYKGDWSINNDKLYKGDVIIEGDYTLVDEIFKQTGSLATIFKMDTRISTNVLKQDGSRAVGTKVSEKVAETVLKQGKEYIGEANVLENIYETRYMPLKDSSGKVVGIWFVGVEKSTMENQIKMLDLAIGLVIMAAIAVGTIIFALFSGVLSRKINKILIALNEAACGNLKARTNFRNNDEIGCIAENVDLMMDKTGMLINEIKQTSIQVASSSQEIMGSSKGVGMASEQITSAVMELAKGAAEQALLTDNSNMKISEMIENLKKIADEMSDSEKQSDMVREIVKEGEKSVKYQEIKMAENKKVTENINMAVMVLSEKSKEIGRIIEVIKGIADQTNLLALNAAIEAARAGEQGKGFTVVSEQIRKLAEQSSISVKQISNIIKEVQTDIENTVVGMRKTDEVVKEQELAQSQTVNALRNISSAVETITENIKLISGNTNILSQNARQVGDIISHIAEYAQETASSTEEVSASTQEQASIMQQISAAAGQLAEMADELHKSIHKFQV